jgi:NAD(P) transhydrogenase subunit alpha
MLEYDAPFTAVKPSLIARRKNRLGKDRNAVHGARQDASFRVSSDLPTDHERLMKISIVKERRPHETRVAATPETVKKLKALGAEITIEAGAGTAAAYTDQAYADAGATIVPDAAAAIAAGDILFKIQRPMSAAEGTDELALLRQGQTLMSPLGALINKDLVQALASKGVTSFALEFMPRISRAQSMDVLSSQANLAGYKAVVDAASLFGQALPMMMTAAGTVPAAKTFIMGVGVAGLQAIATARRLGAVVSATDVRPATKEQVQSLGAKFIAVEDDEFKQAQTAAGYAKPMSPEYQAKQAELVANHIKIQDIVITTALIPGRPAPKLVTAAMLSQMKPGSVIVDLAAERGGNVEGTVPGQTVEVSGVKIVGAINLAASVPVNASSLYAKNLYAFLELFFDKKEKTFNVNWDDEIIKGTLVAKDGKIVHPNLVPQPAA